MIYDGHADGTLMLMRGCWPKLSVACLRHPCCCCMSIGRSLSLCLHCSWMYVVGNANDEQEGAADWSLAGDQCDRHTNISLFLPEMIRFIAVYIMNTAVSGDCRATGFALLML